MNNFFINITKDLVLKEDNSSNANTLEDVLTFFNGHSRVETIRRNIKIDEKFSFQQVIEDLVRKIVLNLDSFKATPVGESTVDVHLPFTIKIINLYFKNNCFPDDLKLAEVSPVYKNKDDLDKEIKGLLVFYLIVYNQTDNFMKDKLSNLLSGFRKNHFTQHCLMCMLEIWKNIG